MALVHHNNRLRSLPAAIVTSVVLVLAGCSSPSGNPPDTTVVTPVSTSPALALPDGAVLASLDQLLSAVLAGDDPARHLVGDRLLVITPETFSEINRSAPETFLASEFSLGGGCAGPCSVRVDVFLRALLVDLRAGSSSQAPVEVPESLQSWKSVVFSAENRTWRVHLAEDAAAVVAVEHFGPVPFAG